MKETIVVDCTHSFCEQLTHHLKQINQRKLMDVSLCGDSSTDAVLNAIKASHPIISSNQYVATNHFDIDSVFSVYCLLFPQSALRHEEVIRECARLGDFRELKLKTETQKQALKIACWMNSEERRLFYRPFESAMTAADGEVDEDLKFDYFLPLLGTIYNIIDDKNIYELYKDEYERVVNEYQLLHLKDNTVPTHKKYPSISLVVVTTKQPLHYYSLFSCSIGQDIVVSIYSGNRYEVETKYTTYVEVTRPRLPRVENYVLAEYLQQLENFYSGEDQSVEQDKLWKANRMTDSGPLLRIESTSRRLSKAERYGHPFERPIYSSAIPENVFLEIIVSFYEYAYNVKNPEEQVKPKNLWSWQEIHSFNSNIDWEPWLESQRKLRFP